MQRVKGLLPLLPLCVNTQYTHTIQSWPVRTQPVNMVEILLNVPLSLPLCVCFLSLLMHRSKKFIITKTARGCWQLRKFILPYSRNTRVLYELPNWKLAKVKCSSNWQLNVQTIGLNQSVLVCQWARNTWMSWMTAYISCQGDLIRRVDAYVFLCTDWAIVLECFKVTRSQTHM